MLGTVGKVETVRSFSGQTQFPGFPPMTHLTITSRNKLDTEQMAMIKETFMSTMGPSLTPVSWGSGCPAWALSTRETLTVAVADSAGSPWSFTTITRLCILPSASSKGRVVRISPLYRPTRKGTAGLLGSCSS
uniref:Uncharacterized protein n=1 Tax=Sphenodon punctatus TaxID=8508 RepID=A0A8D0HI90_SPHPU